MWLVEVQSQVHTAENLCKDWNKKMREERERLQEHKANLTQGVLDGTMDPEVVKEMRIPTLKLAPEKLSKCWALRFRRAYGWIKRSTNAAGVFLDYEHPKMKAARLEFQPDLAAGVDRRLFLNVDQLWRAAYTGCKFTIRKERVDFGSSLLLMCSLDTCKSKMYDFCSYINIDMRSRHTSTPVVHQERANRGKMLKSKVKEVGTANYDHVSKARQSLTIMTSSWADCTPGPLGIHVPAGLIDEAEIRAFNQAHVGEALAISSDTRSHFMTGATWSQLLYSLYSPAFDKQRRKYSLDVKAKGKFLADGWSGFRSSESGETIERGVWSDLNNVVMP